MADELLKNSIHEAEITGFTSEALGVCRIGGRAVFVPRTLPGEVWQVRIVKANRTAVWGRGEALLKPSPDRTEPLCPAFGRCGGCAAMHMSYDCELRFKLGRVNDALCRIGGLNLQAETVLGAERQEGYRNKGIYNFAPGPVCGFYRGRSHDVVETPRCYLQPPAFDNAAAGLLAWMKETNTPAYNESSGTGLIRHLFLRQGDEGIAACIVAAGRPDKSVVDAMRRACPALVSLWLCINKKPGNGVLTDDLHLLWGQETLTQTLCGAKLSLSPLTFFQVNTAQAERLYQLAGEYAKPAGKVVLDLYCGAGSVGLAVARDAAKLIGNDIVPSAVENARRNAVENGVQNAEYYCGDAAAVAVKLAKEGLRPDVILTDPPRKGMDECVLDALRDMSPERIVYISCDPGTLARDLKRLTARGYSPEKCTAIDLFPRTSHVETVVSLVLRKPIVNVNIDIDVGEIVQSKRGIVTYSKIKEYVLEQTGLKVSSLYIAQVKQKCGIIERESYNKPKDEDAHVPQCPPEKEKAILEAFRHFGIIPRR